MSGHRLVGGLSVSDHTEARLRAHLGHLIRWNAAINLVAKSTIPDAWERHVADSAQLVDLAPGSPGHWADLGSGAGFPGFVVAVIMAETSPETRVTLVEADRRKATFLRESARLLDLDVTVRAERIEDAAPLCADVISARALAPLPLVHLMGVRQGILEPFGRHLPRLPRQAGAEAGNGRHQHRRREGFGDVRVEAALQGLHAIFFAGVRGHRGNREGAAAVFRRHAAGTMRAPCGI